MDGRGEVKRVLNISKHDAIGRRFNNFDLTPKLAAYGWHSSSCAWNSTISQDLSLSQKSGYLRRKVNRLGGEVARNLGNINGYFRNAATIRALPDYRKADVLHFHIVHDKWLSLRDWTLLARDKPVVWTWHDPYMMTGHCVYPMGCTKYQAGCLTCPDLNAHFPIKRDRSHKNLAEKVDAVLAIDPLVIVASNWMREMIERSLYGGRLRIKTIPFGVHFSAPLSFEQARKCLDIPSDHIVFGFRAVHSDYKGAKLIVQAMENIARTYPMLPITVIAFQELGMCKYFQNKIRVIEPGWVADDSIQVYYSAMDFFLMPSKAEAFGLMAIEAMATGVCPIVTHGTALPELVRAPVHGISVDHNVAALQNSILMACLRINRYRDSRAERAQFANATYNLDAFCKELATTYDEEIEYRAGVRSAAR